MTFCDDIKAIKIPKFSDYSKDDTNFDGNKYWCLVEMKEKIPSMDEFKLKIKKYINITREHKLHENELDNSTKEEIVLSEDSDTQTKFEERPEPDEKLSNSLEQHLIEPQKNSDIFYDITDSTDEDEGPKEYQSVNPDFKRLAASVLLFLYKNFNFFFRKILHSFKFLYNTDPHLYQAAISFFLEFQRYNSDFCLDEGNILKKILSNFSENHSFPFSTIREMKINLGNALLDLSPICLFEHFPVETDEWSSKLHHLNFNDPIDSNDIKSVDDPNVDTHYHNQIYGQTDKFHHIKDSCDPDSCNNNVTESRNSFKTSKFDDTCHPTNVLKENSRLENHIQHEPSKEIEEKEIQGSPIIKKIVKTDWKKRATNLKYWKLKRLARVRTLNDEEKSEYYHVKRSNFFRSLKYRFNNLL